MNSGGKGIRRDIEATVVRASTAERRLHVECDGRVLQLMAWPEMLPGLAPGARVTVFLDDADRVLGWYREDLHMGVRGDAGD